MRLTLLALIGAVCIALSLAQQLDDKKEEHIDLLQVADQGNAHANEGNREARQWGGGWGGRGGWGRGGWGGGGWGRSGWGGGGWGRSGWGGGWRQ
ncbi:heterogeneous nuclear ribonucleoprotein A1-like [Drosophila novamexicana]|uniref:heterogeneous nuclear ribonucleoprotein A1-like n=1 Tax=Drosophila novamexicana TaxID=47314 RepID=UPI0011E598D7|nr:heterogeneous nuclear ribonucleoprotein A1-like [Drosophila novamexicana]